jgi:hypothetical protein
MRASRRIRRWQRPCSASAPSSAQPCRRRSRPCILGPTQGGAGRVLAGLAAVAALVSFGPQKFLDPQFALIWPAVLAGQVAAGVILIGLFSRRMGKAHVA